MNMQLRTQPILHLACLKHSRSFSLLLVIVTLAIHYYACTFGSKQRKQRKLSGTVTTSIFYLASRLLSLAYGVVLLCLSPCIARSRDQEIG